MEVSNFKEMLQMVFSRSTVVGIDGIWGSGKTLLMTALAVHFQSQGRNIYSNYHLKNIEYTPISLEMLLTLPKEMTNGVVCIDEIEVWGDSYKFFSKSAEALNRLLTQLRKRNIIFIYTTQHFIQSAIRIRRKTEWRFQCKAMNRIMNNYKIPNGLSRVLVHFQPDPMSIDVRDEDDEILTYFEFDGRAYFNYYDTNEVIIESGI